MGKFHQRTLELWPMIEVKNCIFFRFRSLTGEVFFFFFFFLKIFFKLCILVDTGKDWFGIVDG